MKHLKHLFTALLLLYSAIVFAEEVTIGGITYNIIVKAKQATVIAGKTKYAGPVVIPASIEHNDVIYNVTSIGELAFYNCQELTSIIVGDSVTSINDDAFYNCSKLTSVILGDNVSSIGNRAFSYCSNLTNIEMPDNVTSIGYSAFSDCIGLTDFEIPSGVTNIGSYAFSDCSGLVSITIPDGVTSIGYSVFSGCSGLTSVEIPNSVTTIENYTFSSCTSLTSIIIPNSVTKIKDCAFMNCSGLANVTIGKLVRYINSNAFAKCENLSNVYCLAKTVPFTSSDAFDESYPEYMTLYVPAEAIDEYKTREPWCNFGTIVTLTPKCANPVISYSNGKLLYECETQGVEFVSEIKCDDANKYFSNSIDLSATYCISVYATASGYENSETVNATLCWIENGENDNTTNVINIQATAVLVTSSNGVLTISYPLDGEEVTVCTVDGALIATATIESGSATIATGLSKGSVAIVKVGEKSIKIAVY